MLRPAFRDTGHGWQVAAGEGGTCARGLRIVRPEHSMFTELVSSPWVRLRSSTNTQGSPSNRLTILPSQNASSHIPDCQSITAGGVRVKPLSDGPFTAHVGIDWADAKHDVCLQAADSEQREFDRIAHQVGSIDQWAKALHRRFGGPIAVALELAKGPIVYALQKYDFFVLFPINPATLAKDREAFKPSRAKDDPTDAELALDLLLRHPERFAPLKPQSVAMRTLLSLIEQLR